MHRCSWILIIKYFIPNYFFTKMFESNTVTIVSRREKKYFLCSELEQNIFTHEWIKCAVKCNIAQNEGVTVCLLFVPVKTRLIMLLNTVTHHLQYLCCLHWFAAVWRKQKFRFKIHLNITNEKFYEKQYCKWELILLNLILDIA